MRSVPAACKAARLWLGFTALASPCFEQLRSSQGSKETLQDLVVADVYQGGTMKIQKAMKTRTALILSGLLMSCGSGLGQQPGAIVTYDTPSTTADPSLTRFDLDFPGGTPEQLVRAIEKTSSKPVNAIIPTAHVDVKLPPLKLKAVTVPQLFEALGQASVKTRQIAQRSGNPGFPQQTYQVGESYGFRTAGPTREDSVWFFYYTDQSPPASPVECKFYQLSPYLETYKVEDITTAIQTGWKMLGETNPPTISYHKDTKLLIAVGDSYKLLLIEQVLSQLPKEKSVPAKPPEIPKSAPGK
jgi:hypothetical protein